jgi:hypothetical protein
MFKRYKFVYRESTAKGGYPTYKKLGVDKVNHKIFIIKSMYPTITDILYLFLKYLSDNIPPINAPNYPPIPTLNPIVPTSSSEYPDGFKIL